MKYYLVKNKEIPWGDYGDIIYSGFIMTFNPDDMEELNIAELERTGPYVPDIYIPDNMRAFAVTEDFMSKIKDMNFNGISEFKPTIKKKIIDIPWKTWDPDEDFYNIMEDINEPFEIIEYGEHSESVALSMPNVFYFELMKECTLHYEKHNGVDQFTLEGIPNLDVFQPLNMLYCIVSQNFKNFIDKNSKDSFSFREIICENI